MAEREFEGRVALVTGAGGAIGSCVVEELRRRGCTVVAADVSGVDHREADLRVSCQVALDVTDRQAIHKLVAYTADRIGPIDLLVNVAGVASFGSAATLEEEEWDRVLDINLKGTFLCCQAVMPGMKQARFGRIVNIGSVVGKNCGNARPWLDAAEQQRAGNVAYGISKSGVHTMTGFLAKELASFGITVNAVAPGPVATAMTTNFPETLRALLPVGRMGAPADIAHAILFLASRQSGFITGEVIDVNGGLFCD